MKVSKFKALIQVGPKVNVFQTLGNSEQDLINKVKKAGMSLAHIIQIEEIEIDVIKQRGRPAAKY